MKLADLSPQALEKIRRLRYDWLVSKHEGPFDWASELESADPEFLQINGHDVLLPVEKSRHPNITVLRCITGDGGRSLTLFLKDTTYVQDPRHEVWDAGFLAVCDRVEGETFFVAVVYHEWFIVRNGEA
jgi:hypothetical protein